MPVTLQEIRAVLEQDEPQYLEAARNFGAEALPYLAQLVQSDDAMIASKATYLAAYIDAEQTADVLDVASRSTRPLVRVAAAGALRFTTRAPEDVFIRLADDQDIGVRNTTLQSVSVNSGLSRLPSVRNKVLELSREETETALREVAVRLAEQLRGE